MPVNEATVAYEREIARARLPESDPQWLPYSQAAKKALEAYDKAMIKKGKKNDADSKQG